MIIIIMGISGSGKTTIGKLLAEKLGVSFYDADDFHPSENLLKMENGVPLTDDDRLPWLNTLKIKIDQWKNTGAVLACSALKESYRKVLTGHTADIEWLYLDGSKELIQERLSKRSNHFFDPHLVHSQFETLEEPAYGVRINISKTTDEIMDQLIKLFE